MKRIVFAVVLLSGCLQGVQQPDSVVPQPSPIIIPPSQSEAPMLTVGVPDALLGTLKGYMGSTNTVTVKNGMTIAAGADSLTLPSGANFTYTLADDVGVFAFGDPKPTVSYTAFGWKIHPYLTKVVLKPDNTGKASATWNGITREKEFKLTWVSEEVVRSDPPAPTLPEVWIYCDPTMAKDGDTVCLPCRSAKKALKKLADENKLPFKLVVIQTEKDVPTWVTTYPTFYWGFDGDTPRKSTVCKKQIGWHGADKMVTVFKGLYVPLDEWQRAEIDANDPHDLSVEQLRWVAHTYTGPATGVSNMTAKQHLLGQTHGFAKQVIDPLTEWEAGQVHSWHHDKHKVPVSGH